MWFNKSKAPQGLSKPLYKRVDLTPQRQQAASMMHALLRFLLLHLLTCLGLKGKFNKCGYKFQVINATLT